MPDILNSIDGRHLGLDYVGRLVGKDYNDVDPKVVVKNQFSNTAASTAITNTSTETLFSRSYTLPGNLLQPGSVLKIRAQGIATATNATDTLNARLYIGGLSGILLAATGAVDVANNDIFFIDFDVVVRTIGATGTIVGAGMTAIGAAGTATMRPAFLASTTIDTTVSRVIGVSATWSAINAGNSCRLDYLSVDMN